jgi:hypothetical protein
MLLMARAGLEKQAITHAASSEPASRRVGLQVGIIRHEPLEYGSWEK